MKHFFEIIAAALVALCLCMWGLLAITDTDLWATAAQYPLATYFILMVISAVFITIAHRWVMVTRVISGVTAIVLLCVLYRYQNLLQLTEMATQLSILSIAMMIMYTMTPRSA